MTILDANTSRLTTKSRFFIEIRNAHIKTKWKHLSGPKIHQSIAHLKKDFEIASSFVNAFCQKVVSDRDDVPNIANRMLTKFHQQCHLPSVMHLIPPTAFTPVHNLTLFPKFSYQELKNISHGTYEIRLARSYCQAHMKTNNGIFIIGVCDAHVSTRFCEKLLENTSKPLLLQLKLKSRFRANITHTAYALLSLDLNNKYILNEYCCSCRHGRRTIGCCSHVMLIIWHTLYVNQTTIEHLFPSSKLDAVLDKWNELLSSDSESSFDSSSEITEYDSN